MLQGLQSRSQIALQRRWRHTGRSLEHDLTEWINAKSKTHYTLDVVSVSKLNLLFGILPTRAGKGVKSLKRITSQAPKIGKKLPVGHHLGILADKYANSLLKTDGSPPWHVPPPPFNRKQWLRGGFIVSEKSPPLMGINFLMKGIYLASKRVNQEAREDTQSTRTVEVRQRLILSQWYPSKTDLLIEDRVTSYSSQPYNSSEINTSKHLGIIFLFRLILWFTAASLVPPKVGIFSFAFTPTPSMLQAFANLCEDTHRIHFDRTYASSEGYPGSLLIKVIPGITITLSLDLVVQVPLQLIVILDVMMACIPDGLLFRAVDYRVINPLFSGRRIKVYRQWIHGVDKEDDSPVTLEDLSVRTTPPVFKFQSEDLSKDDIPRRAHRRRQGRRSKIKRMALFWTALDDGTVGTVALVILVPRPGKVFWELDNEGYLLRKEGEESQTSRHQESDDTNDSDIEDDDPKRSYYTSAAPFPVFDGSREVDSLGRPITMPGQDQSPPSHHHWSLHNIDEASLEQERLERIKKAEALVKSRDLLRRLFDDEDEDFII